MSQTKATAQPLTKNVHRRRFIQVATSVPLLAGSNSFVQKSRSQAITERKSGETAEHATDLSVIDYGLSFISGKWSENQVRFWVESRTRIIDERTGRHEDFYQCASCKSEHTFAEKDLFVKDNFDFIPLFGPEDGVKFRRKAYLNPNYRDSRKAEDMWKGQVYRLRQPRSCDLLSSNASVRRATHEGLPIVAQTEISDKKTGLRAIIEFPVKTMNIHDTRNLYQVDTGPVPLPDLSKRYSKFVDSISLAFVAFNARHFADFVIEDVTPILQDGREITQVRHYSRILSLSAQNRLYAINL